VTALITSLPAQSSPGPTLFYAHRCRTHRLGLTNEHFSQKQAVVPFLNGSGFFTFTDFETIKNRYDLLVRFFAGSTAYCSAVVSKHKELSQEEPQRSSIPFPG